MKYQGLWAHYWCQRPFTSLLQRYLSTGNATLHLTRRVDHVAIQVDSVTLRCDEMRCKAGVMGGLWVKEVGNKGESQGGGIVDGRNPANHMLSMGCFPYQLVQDSFHQQYGNKWKDSQIRFVRIVGETTCKFVW